VPIAFTPAVLARGVRVHGLDLGTSRVVYRDDVPIGIALLAHRGWTTRLAAMGIAAASRHAGTGQWLLERILAEGRQRGDRRFVLEVITDNRPAFRVYEKAGFAIQRRLLGYQGRDLAGASAQGVEEVDVLDVARLVVQEGMPDLPWQVSGETVAQLGPPAVAFRLGDAFAVLEPQETQVELLGLVVRPQARRRGEATRLLRALIALHAGKSWKIAARVPEEIPPSLFTRLGFVPEPLSQWQMVLNLA
jgi:ribosomal protein S18 acetylase RimI-like enzyme